MSSVAQGSERGFFAAAKCNVGNVWVRVKIRTNRFALAVAKPVATGQHGTCFTAVSLKVTNDTFGFFANSIGREVHVASQRWFVGGRL
ncbi:MAG: hypothetical protein ACFHHU_00620 [Porticoccaceae bacterium]